MAEVFLSYKREDLATAAAVAADLVSEGFSVFFDQHIAVGYRWDAVIEDEIEQAKAIVVLWSPNSRNSEWVRNEARHCKTVGALCPAMIESCTVPIEFNSVQAADIRGRTPRDLQHSEWRRLIGGIERLAGSRKPALSSTAHAAAENPNVAYWEAFNGVAQRHGVERELARQTRSANYLRRLDRSSGREIYTAGYVSRSQGGSIGAYLWLWSDDPDDATRVLESVRDMRELVLGVVGEPFLIRQQTKHGIWVYFYRAANPDDRSDWALQHEWIADRMARLAKAFREVISARLPAPSPKQP